MIIKLPEIDHNDKYPLVKAISKRRSVRDFAKADLSDAELSLILWSSAGITDRSRDLRAAPSAGAIYPITLHVVMRRGVYRYEPEDHSLSLHIEEDMREELARVALGQRAVSGAAVVLIYSYYSRALKVRYKERAFRYVCMEAGHMAENALLSAVSLGLGAVAIGAFYDDFVKDIFKLEHEPLYMVAVGRPV